jgi:hypothetical protein
MSTTHYPCSTCCPPQTERLASEKAKLCSEKIDLEAVLESESEYIVNKLHVQVSVHMLCDERLGLARTLCIRCIYSIVSRNITRYAVIYGVYIRVWPTLGMTAGAIGCA